MNTDHDCGTSFIKTQLMFYDKSFTYLSYNSMIENRWRNRLIVKRVLWDPEFYEERTEIKLTKVKWTEADIWSATGVINMTVSKIK